MGRAWRASCHSCPICGDRGRYDRHTQGEHGLLAPGGHARTRSKGVWCEVLGWLQQQPDAPAAELMDRLILRYPDRYSRRQLRTLQRRVSQWRGVMAKQLVYASAENREIYEERPIDIGPVGVN